MISRQVVLHASMRGHSLSSSEATEASVRGEYSEDNWVPCGGEAPLSRWFSAGVVSLLTRSIGSTSSGWVKSSVGCVKYSISTVATSCICWILWMCPSSSGVLDKLMGKFLYDLT